MKKSKAETAQTRQRIIAAAADEVRRKGVADANVGQVMSAVGLTHGGFYRHFPNRDQLFAEGLSHAMAASQKLMADRTAAGGLPSAIESYLSKTHRDEQVPRCPYAALGSELARDPQFKTQAWAGVSAQIETLAKGLADGDGATDRATMIFALMVGAMTLSRLAADGESDRILALAQRQALAIANIPQSKRGDGA